MIQNGNLGGKHSWEDRGRGLFLLWKYVLIVAQIRERGWDSDEEATCSEGGEGRKFLLSVNWKYMYFFSSDWTTARQAAPEHWVTNIQLCCWQQLLWLGSSTFYLDLCEQLVLGGTKCFSRPKTDICFHSVFQKAYSFPFRHQFVLCLCLFKAK